MDKHHFRQVGKSGYLIKYLAVSNKDDINNIDIFNKNYKLYVEIEELIVNLKITSLDLNKITISKNVFNALSKIILVSVINRNELKFLQYKINIDRSLSDNTIVFDTTTGTNVFQLRSLIDNSVLLKEWESVING